MKLTPFQRRVRSQMAGGVIRSVEIASNLNAKEELVSQAMDKIDAGRWDVVIYEIATRKIESIPAKNVKEFGKYNSVESCLDTWLPRLDQKFDAVAIPTGTLKVGDTLSPSQVDIQPPDLSQGVAAGQLKRDLAMIGEDGQVAIMVDNRCYTVFKTIVALSDNGILLLAEPVSSQPKA